MSEIQRGLLEYERRVNSALMQLAEYLARIFEQEAKREAPWTDRTGNARQRLHAFTRAISQDVVEVWLSHGVEYGVYLETRFQGRYAIIWPTIEAHLAEIDRMLRAIFQ